MTRITDTQAALARYRTVADALRAAIRYQQKVADCVDGYPSGGSGRSSDSTSTTERAALQRLEGKEGVHEAHRALVGITEMQRWFVRWDEYTAVGAVLVAGFDPSFPPPRVGAVLELADVGPLLEAFAGGEYSWVIRNWWNGHRDLLTDGARLARYHRAPSDRHSAVELCDGRQFEGSQLAWVPHSRAHDNGWHDPLCVDVADRTGLCVRCAWRERRYREANGMPLRKRNSYEPAA